MGRIIQQKNGRKTIYTVGENINSLSAETNTYYIGVDLNSGDFEKKNPDKLEASYGKLVPILVKAIQELSVKVSELEDKLNK